MGALAGKNFIGKHTTATDFAKKLSREIIRAFPECSIALGVIENLRGKTRTDATWTLKLYEESGCIRITCLQKGSKQLVRIYGISNITLLRTHLKKLSEKKKWRITQEKRY